MLDLVISAFWARVGGDVPHRSRHTGCSLSDTATDIHSESHTHIHTHTHSHPHTDQPLSRHKFEVRNPNSDTQKQTHKRSHSPRYIKSQNRHILAKNQQESIHTHKHPQSHTDKHTKTHRHTQTNRH